MRSNRHKLVKRFWVTCGIMALLFLAEGGILIAWEMGVSVNWLTGAATVITIWLAAIVLWTMFRLYRGLLHPLRLLVAFVVEVAHGRAPEEPLTVPRGFFFPELVETANQFRELLINARGREQSLREWNGEACRNRDAAILRCRMLTGMAGEISRPLSLIHAYLYLNRVLPGGMRSEGLHEHIRHQLERSQDLLGRISLVGALSERPADVARNSRFGLAGLLHEVVKESAEFMRARRVSHLLRYDPDMPKEVYGDRETLCQMLVMMMRMLTAAGAEQAEIEVSCSRSGDQLQIVFRCAREFPGVGGYASLLRRYHENEPADPPPGAPLPLLRMLWIEAAAANLQAHFSVDDYGSNGTCFRLLLDNIWQNVPSALPNERTLQFTDSVDCEDDQIDPTRRPAGLKKNFVVIGSDGYAEEVLQALYPDCRLITGASPENLPPSVDLLLIFLCGDVQENWLVTAELLLLQPEPPPLIAVVDTRNQGLIQRMRRAGGGHFLPAPTDFVRLDRMLLRLLK